jgi:23S rRNA (adenine2503-C2)-methyltransferase
VNTLSSARRPSLLARTPEDVAEELSAVDALDVTAAECRRLVASVIADGKREPAPRVPVRRTVLSAVKERYTFDRLEVVERATDESDGFVKYLFRSPDGALSEAVRIPLEKPGTFSVCLSSQIGCAMKCDFCATGRMGLTRDLEAWEMVAAFLTVRDEARDAGGRVSGAVFMGQGEPLANYDEVIRACDVLSHPCGGRISGKAISISTVGLVPQMRRYTREGHRYRLVVSLHSALPERRLKLLPIAGRHKLADLADAIAEHAAATNDRVTVAWTVMGGVNHDNEEVAALRELLDGVPVRFNLIDVNDAREDGYRRATDDERDAFLDALQILRAPIVRRYSGGRAKHAACGMLASRRIDDRATT